MLGDVRLPTGTFPPVHSAGASDWRFDFTGTMARHIRYFAGPAATGGGNDYAVVTLWPRMLEDGEKAILVLAGNDNGTTYKLQNYDQKVVLTWAMNHEANPPWLPELLSRLVPALRDIYAEVDVLAFSRGVQAFLSCVPHISSPRWLRDVTNVYLAGGRVWQRQSAEHREEVVHGLQRWC